MLLNYYNPNDALETLMFNLMKSMKYHYVRGDFIFKSRAILIFSSYAMLLGTFVCALNSVDYTILKYMGFMSFCLICFSFMFFRPEKEEFHINCYIKYKALIDVIDISYACEDNPNDVIVWGNIERLNLEKDQPPLHRALEILCHNDTMFKFGINQSIPLSFFQKITANIYTWPDINAS